MPGQDSVTVFVRAGDPGCDAMLRHLQQRGVPHTVRDVNSDPSATAILFGRLGRVAVPTLQVGERLLVGYDPVQLARFLPSQEAEEAHVSFGAAVRGVTAQFAQERGLPGPFGVEVGRVAPGSPAEAAGIVAGDVITAIGAYLLQGGADQFSRAVAARRPGDSMEITVWRDGRPRQLAVTFPHLDSPSEAAS